ncbi:MAG: hypothetical protein LBD14_05390 [Puniceicoccales bacterium]|jgi:hypothetical protein|nr:hypothetical protein [Puniceicoccales bacterium]
MKKTRRIPLILILLLLSPLLLPEPDATAQALLPGKQPTPFGNPAPASPPSQPSPGATAVNNTNAGTSGDYKSSTTEGMADRLFNVNSDSIDFENGTFVWKGRQYNLGNSRLMRARLGRYLNAPKPDGDPQQYQAILNRIETLLTPKNVTKDNYAANLQQAWLLLYEAATYEADAGNSLILATLVEKTARMRDETKNLQMSGAQLERLREHHRDNLTSYRRNIEVRNDTIAELNSSRRRPTAKSTTGTDEALREQERVTSIAARLLKTEAAGIASALRARVEFQSQSVAFLLERRFRHTLLANAFYRQLFSGGAHDLRVGREQVKQMLPISGYAPTVDTMDMLAREAIKDADTGIKTVLQTFNEGNRYAAFERIQETFFLGEFEPAVMYFDPEKKTLLNELWQHLQNLQRMGDERDLAGVEDTVAKVKALAQDFPAVQIMSRVNNAIQTSNLAVLSARQAAFSGDTAKAEAQIERAVQIWPTNPAIKDFATQALNHANVIAQKVPEFDSLLQSERHRDIFNKKEDFALALLQDKERTEKLKTVINNIGKLDGYLLNARVLASQGNSCMAWDILQTATTLDANDPLLSNAIRDLAPTVAHYARLLDTAEKEEKNGSLATSLTAYLMAQDMNPSSEHCRRKIQHLGERILAKIPPENKEG